MIKASILIICSMLFPIFLAHAVVPDPSRKYVSTADMPLEFHFLLEGLQAFPRSAEEVKIFEEDLKNLDKSLKAIPKKYFFFILKSEIYKGIFNHPLEGESTNIKIDEKSIRLLNQKLMRDFNRYLSFSRWFIESLQSDLWEVSGIGPIGQRAKFATRLKILRPWYEFILQTDAAKFNEGLRPLMKEILENILQATSYMMLYSRFKGKAVEEKSIEMTYFKLAPEKPKELAIKKIVTDGIRVVDDEKKKERNGETGEEGVGEFIRYQEAKKSEALRIIGDLSTKGDGQSERNGVKDSEADILGWRPQESAPEINVKTVDEMKGKAKKEDEKDRLKLDDQEWKPR